MARREPDNPGGTSPEGHPALRALPRLALVAAVTLGALLLVELTLRAVWRHRPTALTPYTERLLLDVMGRAEPLRVRPRTIESYFTVFSLNSRGYRGAEHPVTSQGDGRIAVVGDSFVFGVAMDAKQTLPARLEADLRAAGLNLDVINAGYPSADPSHYLATTRRVLKDYNPDLVMMVLSSNDLDQVHPHAPSPPPPLHVNSRGRPQGMNLMGRMGEAMLPSESFSSDAEPARSRYWLARHYRTWLWLALHLRDRGTIHDPLQRTIPLAYTESIQMDRLVWGRLKQQLLQFNEMCRKAGAQPVLVLYSDEMFRGIAARRITEAARAAGVPLIDLSPLWGEAPAPRGSHTLGWDGHPNADALARAARVLAAHTSQAGWFNGPDDAGLLAVYSAHQRDLASHRTRRQKEASRQRQELRLLRASFHSELRPGASAGSRPPEDQWLYGWWPLGGSRGQRGPGRWMSAEAAFFLRAPAGGATGLRLEAMRPGAAGRAQGTLEVVCGGTSAPVRNTLTSGKVNVFIPLERAAGAGEVVECRLIAPPLIMVRPPKISDRGGGQRSLLVHRLALERADD